MSKEPKTIMNDQKVSPSDAKTTLRSPILDAWGSDLERVPDELKTPELCMQAVRFGCVRGDSALKWVPDTMKTPEFCMAAVRACGRALEFVPEGMKTPEFCMAAVRACGRALEFVPEGMKTPEICRVAQPGERFVYSRTCAVSTEPVDGGTRLFWCESGFPFVPDELKTPEMCVAAVMACPFADALGLVPDALMTEELCIAAMHKSHGKALKFVPERLRTPDVLYTAERARRAFEVESHISLVS